MSDEAISTRRTAAFLNRMLVVFFATFACALLQRYSLNLLDFIAQAVTGGSGMRPGANFSDYLLAALAGSGGFMIFQIGWILTSMAVFLAFAIAMEWKAIAGKPPHIAAWTLAGIIGNPIMLAFGGVSAFAILPKILVIVCSGFLYWRLAGRRAGAWRRASTETAPRGGRVRPVLRIVGYAFLAFVAYNAVAGTVHLGRLVLYGMLMEANAGTPPFKTLAGGEPGMSLRLAMHDFPDPAACLKTGAATTGEDLKQMDWARIGNTHEAEVCMFRLLALYGDASRTSEWLESQGFRSDPVARSGDPVRSSLDQTLSIQGHWPIKKQGHPFRERGLAARLTGWLPYALHATTTWSPDGVTLLSVNLGYLTL